MKLADSESRTEWFNRCCELQNALGQAEKQLKTYETEIDRLTAEKGRRIYYQDLVYFVCRQIDKIAGGKTVCGTAGTPNIEEFKARFNAVLLGSVQEKFVESCICMDCGKVIKVAEQSNHLKECPEEKT